MAENGIAIGLDIDEKSVKFVKIKQTNGSISLLKYAVRDIPQIDDKVKATSEAIKELFKGEKSDIPVYTIAFGPSVSLKRISIPIMPDEEMPDAIKWEAKNLVPFPLDNAAIDFYKIGKVTDKNVEKFDIMFAVAGEEFLNFISAVSRESGIKFTGTTLIPLALASLLKYGKKFEEGKVTAIIDIGSEAASINIFKGDLLHFTREITVAGDSLTKSMTGLLVADHWQLNLTYEQAEDIKKKFGIPKKDTPELTEQGIPLVHIFEMMAPTLRRLQNEIQRSFDYYKEAFREERIDQIFVTGGSSKLKNLEEFLSNALGMKVETIDPLKNVKLGPSIEKDAPKLEEVSSRLALAIGLALEKSEKINFRTAKEKPRASAFKLPDMLKLGGAFKNVKLKVPANLSVWAVVALIVIGIAYNVYLSKIKAGLQTELSTKQVLLGDIQSLVEKRTILDQISKEETHVRETLSQVTRALPANVTLTDIIYDNSNRELMIAGDADTTKTVGITLKNFQDSPSFTDTTLIEARKGMVDGRPRIYFKMSVHLT